MELELLTLTDEEWKLIKYFREMTESDKRLCLILAARFSMRPAEQALSVVIKDNCNTPIFFNCGSNSNNHSPINQKTGEQ